MAAAAAVVVAAAEGEAVEGGDPAFRSLPLFLLGIHWHLLALSKIWKFIRRLRYAADGTRMGLL